MRTTLFPFRRKQTAGAVETAGTDTLGRFGTFRYCRLTTFTPARAWKTSRRAVRNRGRLRANAMLSLPHYLRTTTWDTCLFLPGPPTCCLYAGIPTRRPSPCRTTHIYGLLLPRAHRCFHYLQRLRRTLQQVKGGRKAATAELRSHYCLPQRASRITSRATTTTYARYTATTRVYLTKTTGGEGGRGLHHLPRSPAAYADLEPGACLPLPHYLPSTC